ncbi:MAG: protein kinase domain-containing protein [Roseiflexus sp.]
MSTFPEKIGNYRLERQIGKGGMSQVWLARHCTLRERRVAIKILLSQDTEWIDRFTREAEITSQLRHEHIVPIYDHGQQAPFHYTVMEYVEGGSLRDLLDRRGRLPLDLAAHIFRCAAAALDYAHTHGVVHRDISTGNILVESAGKRVLLSDFGIARDSGKSQMTTVNKVMGTPGFLSPEHAASATAVTHLSDIYSLGVVLFVMLAGALPWTYTPGLGEGGGPFAPPMSLRDRGVTGVPAEVDDIIRTMLALEPVKRYPSAQAATDALEQVLRRHSRTTQIASTPPAATPVPTSLPETPHAVEKVLANDLIKAPMQEALARAKELSDPRTIAHLLNEWSRARPLGLRRPSLGRLAAIRQITHRNIYWYTLRVLYETREPAQTEEEPDHHYHKDNKLERELDRWEVALPAPEGFENEAGGVVHIPGSTRVVLCDTCKGIGRTICPRCNGRRRIPAPSASNASTETQGVAQTVVAADGRGGRISSTTSTGASGTAQATIATQAAITATPAIIPCPDCQGTGGIHCTRCDGTGRLVVHKTFRWQRQAARLTAHDDLPGIDEQWLRQNCRKYEVYREHTKAGFRPEWRLIPEIDGLIKQAEERLSPNTHIILSELMIGFIPVTEIIFDLDEWKKPKQPGQSGQKREPVLYRWYIYGFERLLPDDRRFLNWDRIAALTATGLTVVLAIALALLML